MSRTALTGTNAPISDFVQDPIPPGMMNHALFSRPVDTRIPDSITAASICQTMDEVAPLVFFLSNGNSLLANRAVAGLTQVLLESEVTFYKGTHFICESITAQAGRMIAAKFGAIFREGGACHH